MAGARYTEVKRPAAACLLVVLATVALPVSARAEAPAFRTIVDGLVPPTQGLTITGTPGGCDFLLQNQTGLDVQFFDQANPPKVLKFAASKQQTAPVPVPVHLQGAWPCSNLPALTEEQRWNHATLTVLAWSLRGQVGSNPFQLQAHTVYDPALDEGAQWMFMLRIAAGVVIGGGLLVGVPYLLGKRREIFGAA